MGDILKSAATANGNTIPGDEEMTEQLKSLYQPENTVAAVSAGEKLKEAFSEVTMLVATPQMRKRTGLVYFLLVGRCHGLLRAILQHKKHWRRHLCQQLHLWICGMCCLRCHHPCPLQIWQGEDLQWDLPGRRTC